MVEGETSGPTPSRVEEKPAEGQTSGLGGFGSAAAIGEASLGLIVVAAGLVVVGAAGVFSAERFGEVTTAMFLGALVAFGHMLTQVIKTALASR